MFVEELEVVEEEEVVLVVPVGPVEEELENSELLDCDVEIMPGSSSAISSIWLRTVLPSSVVIDSLIISVMLLTPSERTLISSSYVGAALIFS